MSLLNALLIAVFFLIMGAAIVGLIWYYQSGGRAGSAKSKGFTPADPNLSEVALLMRDRQTQDLVVGMNGSKFRSANELSPAQMRRLTFASSVLAKWLVDLAPGQLPAEETAATPPEENRQADEWVPAESIAKESIKTSIPPFTEEVIPEVKPVSTQIPDVVGGILKPNPPSTPTFKSIAMQINDILQAKIAGTPFEKRGIMVKDGPDSGVVVTLDGEKYPGVKDVPDEEVRNLIRECGFEWEKQAKSEKK